MRIFSHIPVLLLLVLAYPATAQDMKLGIPVGHTQGIVTIDFSTDGKTIVTGSYDESVNVWDAASGKLLHTLEGQVWLSSATFNPNGQSMLTTTFMGFLTIWDNDFEQLARLPIDLTLNPNSVTYSPDGKYILSANHLVKILNAKNGEMIYDFNVDSDLLHSGAFSHDGEKIAVASSNDSVKIWDAKSGTLLHSMEGNFTDITTTAFSPDDKFIALPSMQNTIKIWDIENGKLIRSMDGHADSVTSAIFSPDGNTIATASADSTAKIWNAADGEMLYSLTGHTDIINSVVFSPDGKTLLTTSSDETAKLYDAENGSLLHTLDADGGTAIFSPNGRIIVTAHGSTAKIWDPKSGRLLNDLEGLSNHVNTVTYNPDDQIILTASNDHTAKIWDAKNGTLLNSLKEHSGPVYAAEFSPDGQTIITASGDSTAKIWNGWDGELLHTLKGHTDKVYSARFGPNGKHIITASDNSTSSDHTLKIWEATSGKLLHNLRGHSNHILSYDLSPDGQYVATASEDSTAKIWDFTNGELLHTLPADSNGVVTATFSPNSKTLLTMTTDGHKLWDLKSMKLLNKSEIEFELFDNGVFSPDGTIFVTTSSSHAYIWDTDSGKLLHRIAVDFGFNYENHFQSVTFHPDGRSFVTTSSLKKAEVWDPESGELLHTLKGRTGEFTSIGFDSAGEKIITALSDGSFIIWDVSSGEQIAQLFAFEDEYMTLLPSGYYQSTRDAVKELYYINPQNQIITFDQLDVKFNRPDKVLQKLGNTDRSLEQAYAAAYEKRIKNLDIDTAAFRDGFSFPEAGIQNRESIEFNQEDKFLELHLTGHDSSHAIDRYNIFVNESPVFGKNGVSIRQHQKHRIDTTITVELSQGENRMEASVTNVNGIESFRIPLHVQYEPVVPEQEKLYFAGIGIDVFAEEGYDLSYSVKDIRDLARHLKNIYGDNIVIDTLFNSNVTVANVRAMKDVLKKAGVNDKVIIAYSGHGLLNSEFDYFLSTYDVNFQNPDEGGLSYEDFEDLADGIKPRKKLMLIDACHSGEVDKDEYEKLSEVASTDTNLKDGGKGITALSEPKVGSSNSFELMQELFVNVSRSTGATIISAAAGTQFAYEQGDLENGVFTYSILQLMKNQQTINVQDLKKQVGETVEELTQGLQKPTSRMQTNAFDWQVW